MTDQIIIDANTDLGPALDRAPIIGPQEHDVRRIAVEHATVDGLCAEFGVAGGGSAQHLISLGVEKLYGFDWFYGLPEHWEGHVDGQGSFSTQGQVPTVGGLEIYNGLFKDTLPVFKAEHEEPMRLVHVDCDLYSSTDTVLRALEDRIVVGTVLIFDELRGYEAWRDHEARALMEHMARTGYAYEVLGRSGSDQRFAMKRIR